MKKEMRTLVAKRKKEAAELVRYANPNSRKTRPTKERVWELLDKHIPYAYDGRSAISDVVVLGYSKNSLIKSGKYLVTLENGRKLYITAYQSMRAQTLQEKKEDETATFPLGLFNVFCTEYNNKRGV